MATDERRIGPLARQQAAAQRLMPREGMGAGTATALVATMGNGQAVKNGRPCAAWLGRVPRHYASGGKQRLGHLSTRGDVSLRTRLIHGARGVLPLTGQRTEAKSRGAARLKPRRGHKIAAVALAAKHARMMGAMLARAQESRRVA
jgi:transposase